MAWPVDVAAHALITAAYINSVKNSVKAWPGQVDAQTNNLINVGNLGIGGAPGYRLDVQGGRSVLAANNEAFALGVRYGAATNGFWLGCAVTSGDFIVSNWGGTERFRVAYAGGVRITGLPTSSAGLSSGDLWRDAAAGNVIKMVP